MQEPGHELAAAVVQRHLPGATLDASRHAHFVRVCVWVCVLETVSILCLYSCGTVVFLLFNS